MDSNTLFAPWLIWFVLGIVLALLELQIPGVFVIFFGLGCWVVALGTLIWDLSLAEQIGTFIVATVASIVLLRRYMVRIFRGDSSESPSDGLDDLPTGQHVKVLRDILPNETGRIQYRGTPWDAVSEEAIREGETAEIVRYAENSRSKFVVKKV